MKIVIFLFLFLFGEFVYAKDLIFSTPYGRFSILTHIELAKAIVVSHTLEIFTVFYCLKFIIFRTFVRKEFFKNLGRFLLVAIPNYFITLFGCAFFSFSSSITLFVVVPFIPTIIEYFYYSFIFSKEQVSHFRSVHWFFISVFINYGSYLAGAAFFHIFLYLVMHVY